METQRMIKLHKFEYELYIIDFFKSVLNILSEIVLCINGCLLIFFLHHTKSLENPDLHRIN